jgi:hypothetical protein
MSPLPPKRQVWEDARAADARWAGALAAHRAAEPGSRNLRERLRATAAAAVEMAAVARRAEGVGLAWAVLDPGEGEVDALPGELGESSRWLCAEWVAVERAERAAVAAARTGTLSDLADAFDVLADVLASLADVADEPYGAALGATG